MAYKMTWIWLRRGNLKRETESQHKIMPWELSICFGERPHDVTLWTLPDTINSDWLDKRVERVLSVTGNRYCQYFCKRYNFLCY